MSESKLPSSSAGKAGIVGGTRECVCRATVDIHVEPPLKIDTANRKEWLDAGAVRQHLDRTFTEVQPNAVRPAIAIAVNVLGVENIRERAGKRPAGEVHGTGRVRDMIERKGAEHSLSNGQELGRRLGDRGH